MNERTPPTLPIPTPQTSEPAADMPAATPETPAKPRLEPTRYGDWELNGKCVDF